jgi:hypothetical protein
MSADREIVLKCSCVGSCTLALVLEWLDFEDQPKSEWWLDFYTSYYRPDRFRHRVKAALHLLRRKGDPPYVHAMTLDPAERERLRAFLESK